MIEQVYLSERLDALVVKMREAAAVCGDLAGEHEDIHVRGQLSKLCREKQRSMLLVERLGEILE